MTVLSNFELFSNQSRCLVKNETSSRLQRPTNQVIKQPIANKAGVHVLVDDVTNFAKMHLALQLIRS